MGFWIVELNCTGGNKLTYGVTAGGRSLLMVYRPKQREFKPVMHRVPSMVSLGAFAHWSERMTGGREVLSRLIARGR